MKLESLSRNPAIITFKRGTIIKVDHFRIIKPKRLLVMGIGRGSRSSHATHGAKHTVAHTLPDFGRVDRVRVTPDSKPRENPHTGGMIPYDAATYPVATYKFDKIMTANLDNVLSIKQL